MLRSRYYHSFILLVLSFLLFATSVAATPIPTSEPPDETPVHQVLSTPVPLGTPYCPNMDKPLLWGIKTPSARWWGECARCWLPTSTSIYQTPSVPTETLQPTQTIAPSLYLQYEGPFNREYNFVNHNIVGILIRLPWATSQISMSVWHGPWMALGTDIGFRDEFIYVDYNLFSLYVSPTQETAQQLIYRVVSSLADFQFGSTDVRYSVGYSSFDNISVVLGNVAYGYDINSTSLYTIRYGVPPAPTPSATPTQIVLNCPRSVSVSGESGEGSYTVYPDPAIFAVDMNTYSEYYALDLYSLPLDSGAVRLVMAVSPGSGEFDPQFIPQPVSEKMISDGVVEYIFSGMITRVGLAGEQGVWKRAQFKIECFNSSSVQYAQNNYCSVVDDGSGLSGSPGVDIPSIVYGETVCYDVNQSDLQFTIFNRDVLIPRMKLCFQVVQLPDVNIFGLNINLDRLMTIVMFYFVLRILLNYAGK